MIFQYVLPQEILLTLYGSSASNMAAPASKSKYPLIRLSLIQLKKRFPLHRLVFLSMRHTVGGPLSLGSPSDSQLLQQSDIISHLGF